MLADTGSDDAGRLRETRLPISRVKTIMKSSPNVDTVGAEPLFLVTKVTELFIADLAKMAFKEAGKPSTLDYKHIAEIVQTDDTLDFLREIMPRKMTVREYRKMAAARGQHNSSDSDSSTNTSDTSDESDEQST